jgi:hypothetical protein
MTFNLLLISGKNICENIGRCIGIQKCEIELKGKFEVNSLLRINNGFIQ